MRLRKNIECNYFIRSPCRIIGDVSYPKYLSSYTFIFGPFPTCYYKIWFSYAPYQHRRAEDYIFLSSPPPQYIAEGTRSCASRHTQRSAHILAVMNDDDAMLLRSREHFSDAYLRRLERGRDPFVTWAGKAKNIHEPDRLKAKSLDLLLEAFSLHCLSKNLVYEIPLHATLEAQIQRPDLKKHLHYSWSALRKWHDSMPSSMRTPLPYPLMETIFLEALVMAFFLDSGQADLWLGFAVAVRLSFFGMLRPGEAFSKMRRRRLALPSSFC